MIAAGKKVTHLRLHGSSIMG